MDPLTASSAKKFHSLNMKGFDIKYRILKKTLFIEFHPTENLLDWLNVRLKYKKRNGVHLGYLRSYFSCANKLEKIIETNSNAICTIEVIGFGIGGAIAQVFCLFMSKHIKQPIKIITYDSPTPFNQVKREEFDTLISIQEHYIFGFDLIGTLPIRLFGYAFPKNQRDYRIV
ncbi:lipase family protein [Flammeovirga kamogawensis]|uniref:Fungal lipase-type domain-containing protein n=1 Tax=Flammeovirga kamogawensis TaxID=373891 RepID=A0ABX8H1L0_9BACT|nr:lipase family protein [Flammeovirga kamogawensis]MBB6463944.1 hypothetical protein [Flammeovirga kamogawensis]QWG09778.1 hypothetical protein KM029_19045 [Flammeovirga kamogawensis]TRX65288.1 hypothetical protein EO216_22455 [Flammeovirga kamogawensis]